MVRLVIAGGVTDLEPSRWEQIRDGIHAWGPDAVLWTGGLAGRSGEWATLPPGLREIAPSLAVPAASDLRGDPRGKHFAATFASGDRWVVDTPAWRLVGAPAARNASSHEAGFWLPRVLGPTARYGRAIAVFGAPPRSLVPDLAASIAPRLAAIAREAAGERLPLVVGGGTGTNELFLPDGPFGTAILVAGNSGGAGYPWPDRPVVGLQPEFALGVAMERAIDGDALSPLAGFWTVVLGDERLDVAFHLATAHGQRVVVEGVWEAEAGWRWSRVER